MRATLKIQRKFPFVTWKIIQIPPSVYRQQQRGMCGLEFDFCFSIYKRPRQIEGIQQFEEKNFVKYILTFGFSVIHLVGVPILVCALTNVLRTTVFPPPVGPTIIVQCRVNIVSYN